MKDLDGKIVLIPGAGRGIGKAIALAFAIEQSRYVTLMLASDRARGITGQAIQVDGGAVMA